MPALPAALLAVSLAAVTQAVQAAPDAKALATALARDAVPPEYKGHGKVEVIAIPPDERAQGVVGAVLVALPDKTYIRYFVFDTLENARRSYKRYAQQPWGAPMQRVAQDELKPGGNLPRGDVTCELQKNTRSGIYAGACLHFNVALPVLVRGTLPVKFDDRLKLGDKDMDKANKILSASVAINPTGAGARQAERVARALSR